MTDGKSDVELPVPEAKGSVGVKPQETVRKISSEKEKKLLLLLISKDQSIIFINLHKTQ